MLECVINVSEGRVERHLARLRAAGGDVLLDVHRDADHHRSVFTLAGAPAEVEAAARRVARESVAVLDLRAHRGAHPRLGVLDVVPWVALQVGPDGRLGDGDLAGAVAARDRFARWASTHLALPCFLYGPVPTDAELAWDPPLPRQLPDVRRQAWRQLPPDLPRPAGGPAPTPDARAGAVCVGARRLLVAYNLWLAGHDPLEARRVAAAVRSPQLRTLGLTVGARTQVSCNLVDPWSLGPADAYDAVAARAEVARAELVGLVPGAVLDAIPPSRWAELDLSPERTIEARLAAGLDGGSRLGV